MTESELADIIENTKGTVFQAVRRHLPGELSHQIEDIIQETYTRFYLSFRSRPLLSSDDLPRYLYVAARNECRKAARKFRRESNLVLDIINSIKSYGQDRHISDGRTADDQRAAADLMGIRINHLPEPYRETALLRLGGRKLYEIARQQQVSVGTVKSRLARAREKLSRLNVSIKNIGGSEYDLQ